MNNSPPELTEAAKCWIFHPSGFPERDDRRVLERFGTEKGARLLILLKQLQADYNSSVEWPTTRNVDEMLDAASRDFASRHPGLPAETAKAFSDSSAYDFR